MSAKRAKVFGKIVRRNILDNDIYAFAVSQLLYLSRKVLLFVIQRDIRA